MRDTDNLLCRSDPGDIDCNRIDDVLSFSPGLLGDVFVFEQNNPDYYIHITGVIIHRYEPENPWDYPG